MERISVTTGRLLLALLFLMAGIRKFTETERMVAYMQSHDIAFAPQLLVVAGLANLIGAAALMSGRYVKLAAYGFVVYLLLVNFMLHDFWTMPEARVAHETQNFVKNLGILAGLLTIAGYATSRPICSKAWWRSDKYFQ